MPEKYTNYPALQELVSKINQLFATKASLASYQPLIDSDHKLSKDLVSGLGTAAAADTTDFATAAQGAKADAAIPDPGSASDGQLLMYDATEAEWIASDAPATGVLSISNASGNDTITIGGTAAEPTIKVKDNLYVEANTAITAGTNKTKLSYDAKGLITAGGDLEVADIPNLPTSKITSGTFADSMIASANTWNAKQDALTFTGTYSASTNKVVLADYVADAVALAANGGYEVVTVLPEPTEANYKKRMIYLYQPAGVTNYYEEYIIARSGSGTEQDPYVYTREKLGDTDIELVNYWAKADLVAITTAEVDALFE